MTERAAGTHPTPLVTALRQALEEAMEARHRRELERQARRAKLSALPGGKAKEAA